MQNNEQVQQHPAVLFLQKYLLHNWRWKLLSLFLAVCLWAGLITQDASLTREKTFTDVQISISNADTLRRNGYIIVGGLENLPKLRMRVEVPQRIYGTVTASNYNPRIDLSKIKDVGEQTLKISFTNTTTYGSVTSISEESVTLQVEEYVTRSRIPVRLNVIGELQEGLYASSPSCDPVYVTVSGPKSCVDDIVRLSAQYDLSMLHQTGTERTAVPFQLVNAKGETVDASLIEVTSESVLLDSILVEQQVSANKELPISTTSLTVGSPLEGYAIKSITVEPSAIFVAGSDTFIAQTDSLQLSEYVSDRIDVTGATSTIRRSLRLVKRTGIDHFSQETVLLTVEIGVE